jgi:hypothetical protein
VNTHLSKKDSIHILLISIVCEKRREGRGGECLNIIFGGLLCHKQWK